MSLLSTGSRHGREWSGLSVQEASSRDLQYKNGNPRKEKKVLFGHLGSSTGFALGFRSSLGLWSEALLAVWGSGFGAQILPSNYSQRE